MKHDKQSRSSGDSSVNSPTKEKANAEAGSRSKKDALMAKLPTWLSTALRDKRKTKSFVRVMVVFVVMLVLLVDTKTLHSVGNAAFFGLIVLCILPPSLPLSIFLFVLLTIGIGMLTAWAWSVAAMAASLRARNGAVTLTQEQGALGESVPGQSQAIELQNAAFHGVFLQPASTGIYGLFFFIGTYALGAVRTVAPKLVPAVLFATIVLDVMCSYGPLLPIQQYTLAKVFLIPTAYYAAVAAAATVLIFPQTVNHSLLSGLGDGYLGAVSKLFALQSKVLIMEAEADPAGWTKVKEGSAAMRKGLIAAITGIQGGLGMLELEVSYGRTSAADIKLLVAKGAVMGSRSIGLSGYQVLIDDYRARNKAAHDLNTSTTGSLEEKDPNNAYAHNYFANSIRREMHHGDPASEDSHRSLSAVLDLSSGPLRALCTSNLEGAMAKLHSWNSSRWTKSKDTSDSATKRAESLAQLKAEIERFRELQHADLLKPFAGLFDEQSGKLTTDHMGKDEKSHSRVRHSAAGLVLCFVYSTSLIGFAEALRDFVETTFEIEARNPKNKLQFPTRFVDKAGAALTSKGTDDALDQDIATGNNHVEEEEHASAAKEGRRRRRDPDAEPPRGTAQRVGKKLNALWRWQISDNGIFALRYSVVSILLWLPSILPSSAWFAYENKVLWALIMSQTGSAIFGGEQIAAFLQRVAGTLAGLVLGMLAWYMGSGSTYAGNPYGVVVATTVVTAPFLYLRMVAPQQGMAPWLLTALTINFVVGYSWVNAHVSQVGNSGVGYTLAWKRALLVLIGFAAAFIMALFPRPSSAKRNARISLAKGIQQVSELYLEEISDLLEEAKATDFGRNGYDIAAKSLSHRTHFLRIAGKLQRLDALIGMAAFEPALRGPWPRTKYEVLTKHTFSLLATLAQLNAAWTKLDPRWAKRLVERSPFLEPTFISDALSALSLASYALRNARPLPPAMPLEERLAISWRGRERRSDGLHGLEAELGFDMTWKGIHDEQLAIYTTCTVTLGRAPMLIDLIVEDVKRLVGENEFLQLRDLERELAERGEKAGQDV